MILDPHSVIWASRVPVCILSPKEKREVSILLWQSLVKGVTRRRALFHCGLAGKGPEGAFPLGLEGTGTGRSIPVSTPGSEQ